MILRARGGPQVSGRVGASTTPLLATPEGADCPLLNDEPRNQHAPEELSQDLQERHLRGVRARPVYGLPATRAPQ